MSDSVPLISHDNNSVSAYSDSTPVVTDPQLREVDTASSELVTDVADNASTSSTESQSSADTEFTPLKAGTSSLSSHKSSESSADTESTPEKAGSSSLSSHKSSESSADTESTPVKAGTSSVSSRRSSVKRLSHSQKHSPVPAVFSDLSTEFQEDEPEDSVFPGGVPASQPLSQTPSDSPRNLKNTNSTFSNSNKKKAKYNSNPRGRSSRSSSVRKKVLVHNASHSLKVPQGPHARSTPRQFLRHDDSTVSLSIRSAIPEGQEETAGRNRCGAKLMMCTIMGLAIFCPVLYFVLRSAGAVGGDDEE